MDFHALQSGHGRWAMNWMLIEQAYTRQPILPVMDSTKQNPEAGGWPFDVDGDGKTDLLAGIFLPADYLGQQAWQRRIEALRAAGRQLRTFNP